MLNSQLSASKSTLVAPEAQRTSAKSSAIAEDFDAAAQLMASSPFAAAIAAIRSQAKKSATSAKLAMPHLQPTPIGKIGVATADSDPSLHRRNTERAGANQKVRAADKQRKSYASSSAERGRSKLTSSSSAERGRSKPTCSSSAERGSKPEPRRLSISAYSKALALLGMRELSEKQLQAKLVKLTYGPEEIDAAMHRLRTDGYLSNQRFSESCLQSLARRGKGPRFIQGKLVQAGIGAQSAREDLQNSKIDWLASAKALLAKKFRDVAAEQADSGQQKSWTDRSAARDIANKAIAKRMRFLASRGFPEDVIRQALASLK